VTGGVKPKDEKNDTQTLLGRVSEREYEKGNCGLQRKRNISKINGAILVIKYSCAVEVV